METVLQYIKKTTPEENTDDANTEIYQLSMPLLAAAYSRLEEQYQTILKRMQTLLDADIPKDWKAWMLGRMLLAAELMHDDENCQVFSNELLAILNTFTDVKSGFTAWSWAYLLSYHAQYHSSAYDEYFPKLLEDYEYLLEGFSNLSSYPSEDSRYSQYRGDVIWTFSMVLCAVAQKQDAETYATLLKKFLVVLGIEDFSACIHFVPVNDYRAWLTSLNIQSFSLMKATNIVETLNKLLPHLIDKSPQDTDKMLAMAVHSRFPVLTNGDSKDIKFESCPPPKETAVSEEGPQQGNKTGIITKAPE